MTFSDYVNRFNAYVDTFRAADGSLVDAMQCKLDHTFDVVRFAELIEESGPFDADDRFLASLCALFHDVARFEQVKRFNTYNDSLSKFDHGYEGVRVLFAQDFLRELSPKQRIVIAAAVEFHNKIAIPEGVLDPYALKFAHLTRDADKLAILDLVLRYFSGELEIHDDSLVSLSQNDGTEVSREIVDAVLAGRSASYRMIRNENDFKTCLFGWVNDIHFTESCRILKERNFYGKLRAFLPADPVFDEILTATAQRLSCRCSK